MTLRGPPIRLAPGLRNRREALLLALIAAGMIWFFGWTVSPEGALWRSGGRAEEYYNSEVEGFRSGHLWMAAAASPQLRALANPYDPAQNAPYRLHDASYYRGHYYIYFGVAPAVLFFWPVRALTGRYASELQGTLFFSVAGYLVSLGLLAAIRRRYFTQASTASLAGGALALGLVTMLPALLRRPAIYEVPIACGYAGCMVALAALWRALHSERTALWTALAGVAYGVAIGARPTYAFGALFLLMPVWQQFRERGVGRPALIRTALAAAGPLAIVVGALMLFNYERFGNPFEFGQSYQLSGGAESRFTSHFSGRFLPFNLRVYLLAPARLSAYFPYVTIIRPQHPPAGQFGIEDPFGILPNLPFTALALLGPIAVRGRPRLSRWWWSAGGIALAAAAPVFLFGGACGRYMVDFLPALVLLAAAAVFGLETGLGGRLRMAARLGWPIALAWSGAFGFLASIQHNDLLRINHPAVYAPLARLGNIPSAWVDRLRGTRYGPLELTVKFPAGRAGHLEPLLVNGVDFKSDFIYVFYPDPRHVIFGFEHTGYGGPLTESVDVDFQKEHRLRIDLGALYPPKDDPFFDRWTPAAIEAHVRRLRLSLDGQSLMDDPAECYDPVARAPRLGFSPDSTAFGREFTGVITGAHRVADAGPDPFGAVRLYLELPPGPFGTTEPLLTTGVTGRGDLIRIIYVDGGHVRFVHDRWGFGGAASADIPIRYDSRHRVELSLGSLYPDGPWTAGVPAAELAGVRDRVRVTLDGLPVLDVREPSHPAAPETVAVGNNAIGASPCQPRFTGRILNQQRIWNP